MFTPDQTRKYAEIIFKGQKMGSHPSQRLKCPIHGGRDRNFAFNLDRGVWTCWSRCGSGGLVQLEQKLNKGSYIEAKDRLFKILGLAASISSKQIICTYDYVDASGKLLFQKVRLEGKDFRFRTPSGEFGYSYRQPEGQRPLYGLPGVITANICFITEGEKDADTLNCIEDWGQSINDTGKIYATTSGSADSWKLEHSPYMSGKRVVIFSDNDEKGEKFRKTVSASIAPYAYSVRMVTFHEVEGKCDVTSYLEENGIAALIEKIKKSPFFEPDKEVTLPAIVEGIEFAMSGSVETDW